TRKQKKVRTYIVNELILDKLIKIEPHKIKGAYPQKLDFFHSNFQGSSHWISCGLFILKRLRFVPASFFRSTLNGAYHLEDSCILFYPRSEEHTSVLQSRFNLLYRYCLLK